MKQTRAIYHRTKETNIYPLDGPEGDRFLIEAFLQDEIHDVHAEIEIRHPSLEITAARAEVRGGPFTEVCNMTHPRIESLVGMTVERGFTLDARRRVGGPAGCHRISELVVEIAQAAYQLHFVRYFASLPPSVKKRPDDPPARHHGVLESIPGMRNTCFSYSEDNAELIDTHAKPLRRRNQQMPEREIG